MCAICCPGGGCEVAVSETIRRNKMDSSVSIILLFLVAGRWFGMQVCPSVR